MDNHTPQSSKEAGLDRVLLLRNSTLTSCSHSARKDHWLAFGDIPSFATGRDSRASRKSFFHMREKVGES